MLLQELIEEDFGYEKGGGIWGRSMQHDSLVLNEDTQFWFWNSRGIRGDLKDYLVLVRGYDNARAEKFVKDSSAIYAFQNSDDRTPSPPYEKLVELMWSNGKDKREYWYNRCLTDDTIDKYRLGFFDNWYMIPIYEEGIFINFQCRREVPDKRIRRWYTNTDPFLFNSDLLPFLSHVYMTEGTVDAMLLTQKGFPAVSQNGTNIWKDEWFGRFANIKTVIYIEDNDSAGRNASKMVAKSLGYDRVKIVSYEGQSDKFDTVDFFRSGNNEADFLELVNTTAKPIYEMENIYGKKSRTRS